MLDVSYAQSPLTGESGDPAVRHNIGTAPGSRYRSWYALPGTDHHLLLPVTEHDDMAGFRDKWEGVVEIGYSPDPGVVLVRPDGYVGFVTAHADTAGIGALDAHLESYLIPA